MMLWVVALGHDFQHVPEIMAAEDFRVAAVALGRITGEIDVEELLGRHLFGLLYWKIGKNAA